jgi:hypothetical protein
MYKIQVSNIKSTLMLLALMSFHSVAFAGNGASGGGGGVVDNGHVYVVDLVEAGVEKTPYFDPSVTADSNILKRVTNALQALPDAPVDLVARKLTEIYKSYDRATPLQALEAMEMYSWETVDFSLIKIHDESLALNIPPSKQVQLAARVNQTVKIDEQYWPKLSPENKAALVIHEVVYSLTSSGSSDNARSIVGYLFTANSKTHGLTGYKNIIAGDLFYLGTQTPLLECAPGSTIADCAGRVGIFYFYSGNFYTSSNLSIFTDKVYEYNMPGNYGSQNCNQLTSDASVSIDCENWRPVYPQTSDLGQVARDYTTSLNTYYHHQPPPFQGSVIMTGYTAQSDQLKFDGNGVFLRQMYIGPAGSQKVMAMPLPAIPITVGMDLTTLAPTVEGQLRELVTHIGEIYK